MNAHYIAYKNFNDHNFYKVTPACRQSCIKLKLATLSMALYLIPAVPSHAYAVNKDVRVVKATTLDLYSPNRALLSITIPNVSSKGTQLSVTKTADEIEQDCRMRKFEESFLGNALSQEEQSFFYPVFNQLADSLKKLPVTGQHVPVGRMDGTVTFNLLLPKHILLTVSKAAYQHNTEDVMFSISVNKRILMVERMSLEELMDRVNNTLNELA